MMKEKAKGKPLFRVIAEVEDRVILTITATSGERDAALQNICQYTPAWVMYKLLFDYLSVSLGVTILKTEEG